MSCDATRETVFFDESDFIPIEIGDEEENPRKVSQRPKINVREVLFAQWKEKQKKKLAEKWDDDLQERGEMSLKDIVSSNDDIKRVRKNNVFREEITETEQEIIEKRVIAQRKQFEMYERREKKKRTWKILKVHPQFTEDEAYRALLSCGHDEMETISRLTDPEFVHFIRREIAQVEMENEQSQEETSDEDEESEEEEEEAEHQHKTSALTKSSSSGIASATIDDPRFVKRPRKNGKRRLGKLKLDDALKNAEKGDFEGWSAARIRAFQLIDKNPNAYYYRFNAPTEHQRNGKWTKEEKELFFRRMKEFGVNGKWGLFSMAIPGRVGYQCSNFYRHLVESKRVHDDNYIIDENGKAKFIFNRGPGRRRKTTILAVNEGSEGSDSNSGTTSTKQKKKPKRKKKTKKTKKRKTTHGDNSDDDEYIPPGGWTIEEQEEEREKKNQDNPLAGFIDPITLDEVEQPAISPYGHVMDYMSWSRCLTHNPICPLSKKPLKKRELVLLTWDNIDQYRDKITNWPSK